MKTDLHARLRLIDLRRRSPAYRWLWVRHDAVVEALAEQQPRIWASLAEAAGEDGVKASRDLVRQTWKMVHADWARAPEGLRAADVDPVAAVPKASALRFRPSVAAASPVAAEGDGEGDIDLVPARRKEL